MGDRRVDAERSVGPAAECKGGTAFRVLSGAHDPGDGDGCGRYVPIEPTTSWRSTTMAPRGNAEKAPAEPEQPAEPLKICIDRIVPDDYNPARATTARAFTSPSGAVSRIGHPGLFLALPVLKMWEPGDKLTCCFLDGSPTQRRKVKKYAKTWEAHANITLSFVTGRDAQIRISFEADTGSWSALGTDALIEAYFPRYQPTMNFGWLEDDSPDEEYSRVVIHEFGHALGCIHEHQNPKSGLKWNKAEVYRVFSGAPNFWSKAQIDHNILDRYDATTTNSSTYDGKSIMLYEFPAFLFQDGKGTSANNALSATDKAFIKRMYPKSR
jgi:hypothetical protein